MRFLKNYHPALLVLFLSAVTLLITGAQKNMIPSGGPQGVLYVLTNERMQRFDLETKETTDLFPNLPWEPVRYNHLMYLKNLRKLAFFDYDYDVETDKEKSDFLVGDPATSEAKVLFDFGRKLGLGAFSLSPGGQWFAFLDSSSGDFRSPETAPLPPYQLWLRSVTSGEETLLAEDAMPASSPPIWLSSEDLIYKNIFDEIIQINIYTLKRKRWPLEKNISPSALSPDGAFLLCDDYLKGGRNILLLDKGNFSLKRVMHSWFFLIQSVDFWAPDARSFIYTRHDWTNWSPFHEVGHLFWRDLATGREMKIAEKVALFGGFWLPEDPTIKENQMRG